MDMMIICKLSVHWPVWNSFEFETVALAFRTDNACSFAFIPMSQHAGSTFAEILARGVCCAQTIPVVDFTRNEKMIGSGVESIRSSRI